ncbi:hypothetical protein BD779DRAFT_1673434 [Infundibulicybe gibba]|nr:hypothetical protein BD779DRAFT_1673434 [Infundibulicybe gibba]
MDDSQTTFATQYPAYAFELDMMKRSMDPVGGPDAKKARWSPTSSFPNQSPGPSANASANSSRDAFANYGYGPQANVHGAPSLGVPVLQQQHQQQQQNGAQLSPNPAFAQQQQQPTTAAATATARKPKREWQCIWRIRCLQHAWNGTPGMNMLNGFPYNGQMGNFSQNFNQQQRLPSLTIPSMQQQQQHQQHQPPSAVTPYSPAALTAALSASSNATGRTVYIGNLPSTASVDELLNLVHFGPLESIRVLPEKSCVFLSFLDGSTAAAFHADATIKKLALHNQELKIGWGKPSPVPAQVALAISQSNASRNVYLGGLEEGTTEEMLRDDLSRFGLIDQVKIVRDKNIGFVHFLSISVATKVVNTLPTEPAWAGKRVNYGKDRCAYIPKSQQAAAQAAQAAAAQSLIAQSMSPQSSFSPFSPYSPSPATSLGMMGGNPLLGMGGMNRTVYLGNIHPETTAEDLCNAIRGGVLQSIRYMQDKHIAFVTFVDPAAARLKIGWGKNAGPLPPTLALAVHAGATRNVYIGNVEDFETFSEDRLKRDFGEYGDVELVNFLKEKNCAFNKPEYMNLRIAHGKDRCANPPRSGPQEPVSAVEPEDGEMGGVAIEGAEFVVKDEEKEHDAEAFLTAAAQAEGHDMHVDKIEDTTV